MESNIAKVGGEGVSGSASVVIVQLLERHAKKTWRSGDLESHHQDHTQPVRNSLGVHLACLNTRLSLALAGHVQ